MDPFNGPDDFYDVRYVFEQAQKEMRPSDFILMDNFNLLDAMSAFEIGEPRLDTGMTIAEDSRPLFDPLTPMLPEEVCWIIDRSFACEMEWHSGKTLSQTIFTDLFIHFIGDLNPDVALLPEFDSILERPLELITTIIGASTLGLMKCCDLSWRLLSNGLVEDGEDWQGEKCDVPLLEGTPIAFVRQKLDDAITWLLNSPKASSAWKQGLLDRIQLRKAVLSMMELPLYKNPERFQELLTSAASCLESIRSMPEPEVSPQSPALLCFDPYIARRLNSFLPLRVSKLPPQSQAWDTLGRMLQQWQDLLLLDKENCIATWQMRGCTGTNAQPSSAFMPYLRSTAQSLFYDGVLVVNKHAPNWVVDRFFYESIGISKVTYASVLKDHSNGVQPMLLPETERLTIRLVIGHIRAHWYNPPRRRRYFMHSLLDWHILYHKLSELNKLVTNVPNLEWPVVRQAPHIALCWRLTIIREVILSGFDLELYDPEERPFVLWYLSHILETHIASLDAILPFLKSRGSGREEMMYQRSYLDSLRLMFRGTLLLILTPETLSEQRLTPSFYRRHKWAFKPQYTDFSTAVVAIPDFYEYLEDSKSLLENFSARTELNEAKKVLSTIIKAPSSWAGPWINDRRQFTQKLLNICEDLLLLWSVDPNETPGPGDLRWDILPLWFPSRSIPPRF